MSLFGKLDRNKLVAYAYVAWDRFRPKYGAVWDTWRNTDRETIFRYLVGNVFASYIQDRTGWSLRIDESEKQRPTGILLRSEWDAEIYFPVEITDLTMAVRQENKPSVYRFSIYQPGCKMTHALADLIADAVNAATEVYETGALHC